MARRVTFRGRLAADGHTKQEVMWRCGVPHTTAGADFDEKAFTEAEWARLEADPDFTVSEAGKPLDPDPAAAQALHDRMNEAFAALAPSEFTSGGLPRVAAMQKRLPEDADALTADAVGTAWGIFASAQRDALIERVRVAIPGIDPAVIDGEVDARLTALRTALPDDAKAIDADVVDAAVALWRAGEDEA